MIQFAEHKDIDFDKWDVCIDMSINGLIYPYSFYLNQVSPGWAALIKGDYEAVMPLPIKKKYGFNYLMQPVFVQQLGVFSPSPVNEKLLLEFINSIPSQFRYININLNTFNTLSGKFFNARKSRTYELDLISPYEIIKSNYSNQVRRNLKKAAKASVYVLKHSEPMPVIEAFRQNRGKDISHLNDEQYKTFKYLVFSGLYRGTTEIYSAYTRENTFCAGIIFFTSHRKSILIFSGNTPESRNNGAMTAIIDRFIYEHAGSNLTLDFEGSNEKNLARFYAGFGSKECVFLQLEIIRLPLLLKPLVKWYFQLKKLLRLKL